MSTVSLLPVDTSPITVLPVRPWPDSVIDALGHDPRSTYVESFWLGILGPSTTWLIRRLAAGLEASPAGFELDLADTASALGLGSKGGRHSPFMRALGRCCQFDLAIARSDGSLAVRRKIPPLNRRQVLRLPPSLVAAHQAWQEGELRTPAAEQQRRRARRLALSLLELGEDLDAAERQLLRWKFHPAMCRESAVWAWDRHRRAMSPTGNGWDDDTTGDDGDETVVWSADWSGANGSGSPAVTAGAGSGSDRSGSDRSGSDRSGSDRSGSDRSGSDRSDPHGAALDGAVPVDRGPDAA